MADVKVGRPDPTVNMVMSVLRLARNATEETVRALLPSIAEEQVPEKLVELREYPEVFLAAMAPDDRPALIELARECYMDFVSP